MRDPIMKDIDGNEKKQFKRELLDVFHKFVYLSDRKGYEIKIRTM